MIQRTGKKTSTASGPRNAYDQLVNAKKLKGDAYQEKVLSKLEALHQQLLTYTAQPQKKKLQWLIMGNKATKSDPKGLYIWGSVGRGKSMLMDLFFRFAPLEPKRRIHFHAFMQEVHASIHAFRKQHGKNVQKHDPIPPVAAQIAEQSMLLCLDEFQVTDVADAMILSRLFTELFLMGVVVVATSNLPPDALYAGGLQRDRFLGFVDVLKTYVQVVELESNEDYRTKQLQSLKRVYFTPLGKEADQAIGEVFTTLTQGKEPQQTVIDVQGRKLEIDICADGVACMTFKELCEKPLGAADYLALARRFHTLLLLDVPALSPEKRNEAKRFVTLVDVLYEQKCKLILSAALPPEKLYPKGDESFAFQRTVSRLKEMQSETYLALPHQR